MVIDHARSGLPISPIKINWEHIPDFPFDIKNIRQIISDGSSFLLTCGDDIYYLKNNVWTEIYVDSCLFLYRKIIYINGYWIIIFDHSYRFSKDLIYWISIDLSNYKFIIRNILYYKNEWILEIQSSSSYHPYYSAKFYKSYALDGIYKFWESASWESASWKDVYTLGGKKDNYYNNICVYDGKLIAAFSDSSSLNLAYLEGDSHWRKANFPILKTAIPPWGLKCTFAIFNNHIFAITYNTVLSSTDGYEWSIIFQYKSTALLYLRSYALSIDNFLLLYFNDFSTTLYITHDIINYNKILSFDFGYFLHICSSKNQLLATYYNKLIDNTFLMIGTLNT
jgi:hypothetical protein